MGTLNSKFYHLAVTVNDQPKNMFPTQGKMLRFFSVIGEDLPLATGVHQVIEWTVTIILCNTHIPPDLLTNFCDIHMLNVTINIRLYMHDITYNTNTTIIKLYQRIGLIIIQPARATHTNTNTTMGKCKNTCITVLIQDKAAGHVRCSPVH